MILGIGVEAGVFLYAGLTGMTVWFFYGILICLRKIIPHTFLFVGVEDFLFWIGTSIYIFRKMYDTTYGSIRWLFVLGVVCGAAMGWLLWRTAKGICGRMKKRLEKYRKNR